jgi:ubiquitin-protein ligase
MIRRINKEIAQAPTEGNIRYIGLIDKQKNHQTWEITCGAGDTVAFDGVKIKVNVCIPLEYPFKSPQVKLDSTIFHPNVLKEELCLRITKEWTPKNTVYDVMSAINNIIMYPDLESALCVEASDMFKNNRQKYIFTVIDVMKK